jgi:hypothetical protein
MVTVLRNTSANVRDAVGRRSVWMAKTVAGVVKTMVGYAFAATRTATTRTWKHGCTDGATVAEMRSKARSGRSGPDYFITRKNCHAGVFCSVSSSDAL